MKRFILRRGAHSLLTMVALLTIVFFAVRLTGDPLNLLLADTATVEQRADVAAFYGLDKPLPVQYWVYIKTVARGDLGQALTSRLPVAEILRRRIPATVELATTAMVIALMVALPLGVYAAVRRGSKFDLLARTLAVAGQSVPRFWFGLMLMLIFAIWLGVLPTSGRGGLSHIIMPAITLGWSLAAGIMRLTRSSMLDILDSEYIKLARIKGLPERVVIWKHAFKNALPPVITYSMILFTLALGGSIVTETVFSWPGVGLLVVQAVAWRDFPVLQGAVLVLATAVIIGNFIVDILYAYVNPRIRYRD